MEINGLPLHPLVVHAAVVFGPLAALAALAYLVPSWRARLRWPMVVLAVLATLSIVEKHEDLAGQLLWITIAFGVIGLVAGWFSTRTGALRVALDALLAVGAVLVLIWVVRTGDAGAQAVWSS